MTRGSFLELIGHAIFATRWMLVPLYIGLFAALGAYDLQYFNELWRMVMHFFTNRAEDANLLLIVIDLIDTIMIANLVVMIAIGGYSVFVREYRKNDLGEQKPRWLNDINSSTQKIKMSVSLIGVTSVHLLHTFIEAEHVNWDTLLKQGAIHFLYLVSTIVLCVVDKMLHANVEHTSVGEPA